MTPAQIALLVEDLQPGTLGIRGIDPTHGWMIAIYPDEATKKRLHKFAESLNLEGANVHDPDEYHVTLRYWKGDYDSSLKPIMDWLQASIGKMILECKATELEIFGTENSLVVRLSSPKLDELYNKVNTAIMKLGVPKPNTDTALPYVCDSYKPHITLASGVQTIPERKLSFPIILEIVKLVEHGPILWQASN